MGTSATTSKTKTSSPTLVFLFWWRQTPVLLNDHRKTVEKIQEKRRKKNPGKKPVSTTSKPRPTPPKKPVNNPQINGSKKADMQFFGPKDFVAKSPHKLPFRPMRLKYSSTKEFPTKTYGRLVPMPR